MLWASPCRPDQRGLVWSPAAGRCRRAKHAFPKHLGAWWGRARGHFSSSLASHIQRGQIISVNVIQLVLSL